MANNEKGNPPAALEPRVVKKLLDLLSTDDDFRKLFETDAHAALVEAGYSPPADGSLKSLTDASAQSGGACLQLKQGALLASKEKIVRERAKLEETLHAIQHFLCPSELQSD